MAPPGLCVLCLLFAVNSVHRGCCILDVWSGPILTGVTEEEAGDCWSGGAALTTDGSKIGVGGGVDGDVVSQVCGGQRA